MKSLVIALVVVVLAGCGGKKKKEDSQVVDAYVNVDLAPQLAKVVAARSAYGSVRAVDIDEQPEKMKWLFRDVAAPFLKEAVAGASVLTPPPAAKQLHEDTLGLWKRESDIISAMAAATDPVDSAKFKEAHAQMMDLQESVMSWDRKLQTLLDASGGLKLKPLPDVKIPEPKLDAPDPIAVAAGSAAPAGPNGVPAMCKAGTDVAQDDGSLVCETEMMFANPETPAGTPKEQVVACGPGRVVYDKAGKVVSCVSFASVTVGDTKLDKGTTITFGANASIREAVLPDGKQLCFENAKQVDCP
ncbi:MAG TPA: hypothetical protein VMZ53_19565 [Kofleriaceae bacterium]|nr:hypothetical protein [Kofleriaceae bacterium]